MWQLSIDWFLCREIVKNSTSVRHSSKPFTLRICPETYRNLPLTDYCITYSPKILWVSLIIIFLSYMTLLHIRHLRDIRGGTESVDLFMSHFCPLCYICDEKPLEQQWLINCVYFFKLSCDLLLDLRYDQIWRLLWHVWRKKKNQTRL